MDIGNQWAQENLPRDWLDQLQMPSEDDWREFWKACEKALASGDVEDAAALMPYAETAARVLSKVPGGEDYAAWLQQRIDYFEIAAAAVKSVPEPVAPSQPGPAGAPPSPRPVRGRITIMPSPGAAPPTPVISIPVKQRRRAVAISPNLWKRKLANRPVPASARDLVPQLKRVFRSEGIPEKLVWIAEVESSMNPKARNPSGAAGLFQLMPATAQRFGLRTAPLDERKHPEKSARAAARYLKFLYGEFHSWPLAVAAYNVGEGRIKSLLESEKGGSFEDIAPRLPIETQMYVPKVQAVISLREGGPGLTE